MVIKRRQKKGVVMDKMLIDSRVDFERNDMKSNNVVKEGK